MCTMILAIYTLVHVVISLAGIFSGFVVLFGLLAGKRLDGWTKFFLITTVATSVTGFFFPLHGFTPAIGVGIISLLVLSIAIFARYPRQLAGRWRWIYVVTAMIALYLNVFVAIVQAFEKAHPADKTGPFEKAPVLKVLAPTQSEPPFKLTQLVVLALFVVLTIVGVIRFRLEPVRAV